jgi:hypothetical protein
MEMLLFTFDVMVMLRFCWVQKRLCLDKFVTGYNTVEQKPKPEPGLDTSREERFFSMNVCRVLFEECRFSYSRAMSLILPVL